MTPRIRLLIAVLAGACLALLSGTLAAASAPAHRSGADIMQRFHAGLAESDCKDIRPRWRKHYEASAHHLADKDETALMVFGYVLDKVLEAGLPSEFALIPFVESRYHAASRSQGGPAGLWQFTTDTARRHGMRVRARVDERMSVVSSTESATAYLVKLHRMFGGNWRHTVMAYNAGEGALRNSRRKGGKPLSSITSSYPEKLHAIACLFDAHAGNDAWQRAVHRDIPRLAPRTLPDGTRDLRQWARTAGLDPSLVAALNPGWHVGSQRVLAPVAAADATADTPAGAAAGTPETGRDDASEAN